MFNYLQTIRFFTVAKLYQYIYKRDVHTYVYRNILKYIEVNRNI